MIVHFLKIAFRNFRKYKTQSLVGILGLAFGLACFVSALYWLRYETSYDNFYPEAEHIYRVYSMEKESGKVNEQIPGIFERKLHEQFSAMENTITLFFETNNCSTEETPHIQLQMLNTNDSFFGVFPQTFVCGDTRQPLQIVNNIVLTESVAIRLFGDAEKAIGKQLQSTFYFVEPPYTVTAVVKDPPLHTNLSFEALLNHSFLDFSKMPEEYQWVQFNVQMYVKFHPGTDVDMLEAQMRDFTSKLHENINFEPFMMPVNDVRHQLNSGSPFTLNFIRLFVAAGILVLFSALFNFLNLYLDIFRQRIRELHQRTVHGAKTGQLIIQMLFELSCSILLALVLACLFVIIIYPIFSGLIGIIVGLSEFIYLFVVCVTVAMALILLVSFIPFWRLSRLAMQNLSKRLLTVQPVLRRMAVSLQLAVSVVFIVAALVVMMQMRFVNRIDLGFDRNGIIQLSGLLPYIKADVRAKLIHELEAIPQIENISTSNFNPQHNANILELVTVVNWPGKAPDEKPAFNVIPTDSRFAETFRLKMLMGKWWNEEGGENKIVLNEEAVRVMGLNEPVGTIIHMSIDNVDLNETIEEYEVVGVVNDFHTLSLRSRIHPTIFRPSWSNARIVSDNILYIHVASGQEEEAIQRITAIIPDVDPSFADIRMMTLGGLYDGFNLSEQVGLKMFSVLATVCLLISLFGIYAVATASTLRRRKEIAIRKVAGAKVVDIVRIFFREYTLQMINACVVSLPLAYLAMSHWLQGYAYRTNISSWMLVGVVMGVAAVVLLTVLGQVLKAANSNPAEVVKSE